MKSRAFAKEVVENALWGDVPLFGKDAKTLWLALHLKDPGDADSQETDEVQGIGRAAFMRAKEAWKWDGDTMVNAAMATFTKATFSSSKRVAKYWTIGIAKNGAGKILFGGKIDYEQNIVEGLILDVPVSAIRYSES